MKRRVTSLPPITSEVFTEKVLQAQASSTAAATRASYERTCGACTKTYFSENAYNNHVGSAKHRGRVASLRAAGGYGSAEVGSVTSTTMDAESQASEDDDEGSDDEEAVERVAQGLKQASLRNGPATTNTSSDSAVGDETTAGVETTAPQQTPSTENTLQTCLFCNYESPTVPLNVTHMERIHGMFIPERNYLVDLEGLIKALHQRIYEDHECLYCAKLKPSIFGLQTHMRDKGHCKIPFQTEDEQLEIGEFYDFTSTYSDVEDEEMSDGEDENENRGGVELGTRRTAKKDGNEEMGEGDGWETDSSASSLDSADLTAVPMDQHAHQYEKLDRHPHHSSQDPRPHRSADGWHSHAHKHTHTAFYSDYELHLPSGRSVGHRSLTKYYRQNLYSHPSPAERQEREQLAIEAGRSSDSEDEASRNHANRGRALTSRANLGMVGLSDQKRREVAVTEKKAKKIEEREQRKFQWGNNKQSNSQKHFRVSFLHLHTLPLSQLTSTRTLFCSEKTGFALL